VQIIEILTVTAESGQAMACKGALHVVSGATDYWYLVIGATTTSFDRRLNQAVQ
jgi:hypothetical protein